MRANLADIVLLNELESIAYKIGGKLNLIVCLGIHKGVKIAILVQILHILSIYMSLRAFLGGTESSLNYAAVLDVLKLGADECRSLAGLNMLEIDDLINGIIEFDGNAVSEVTCRNHK